MAICQFIFGSVQDGPPTFNLKGSTVEAETVSGANAATTAAATASQTHVRVCSDTACYVSFGSAPNAGTDTIRAYMPANLVEYFPVSIGDKAAVISDA